MEIFITFSDHPDTKETLKLEKKLSQNKSIYQVTSSKNSRYALKLFPKTPFGATQYQKEKLMFGLDHRNIIQQIPVIYDNDKAYASLTEFGKYGDFFRLVNKNVLNTDILIRTYFHQLVDGLEYIHSQGIAHLDLKLENLVMGSGFILKIIDFDQAQRITDERMTSRGTEGYRAWEVIERTCTNMKAADIYSLGIILYVLKCQEFPFLEIEDPKCQDIRCYSTFVMDNNRFWQTKINQKGSSFFEEDFIELINGMLHLEPQDRWTIKQIKNCSWYKKPILNNESLRAEMRSRLEAFKSKKGTH